MVLAGVKALLGTQCIKKAEEIARLNKQRATEAAAEGE
jgi:hypothetical protein